MVENPAKYFEPVAAAGGDSVTFHFEAVDDVAGDDRAPRASTELQVGVAFNPETEPEDVAAGRRGDADLVLCMGDPSRATRASRSRPETLRPGAAAARRACRARCTIQVDGGVSADNDPRALRRRRARCSSRARRSSIARTCRARTGGSCKRWREPRARGRARARRAWAGVPEADRRRGVVRDGEVVGEGATEAAAAATPRSSRSTRRASAPAARRCTSRSSPARTTARRRRAPTAIVAAGVARVVVGARDPNPEAAGGVERLRAAGVEVEVVDSFEARRQNEAWRTWVTLGRPFVTYKVAVTLDGRVTVPGERWVIGRGEPPARPRAARRRSTRSRSAAGTARADRPRLDARDVDTPRGQPRRLVFSRGPLPDGLELELRSGPLARRAPRARRARASSRSCSRAARRSPRPSSPPISSTSCSCSSRRRSRATGPGLVAPLPSPRTLSHLTARPVGDDVLLEAYVDDP